jgi:hypothetical protein
MSHRNEDKIVVVHKAKACGELEAQRHAFLLSAVDGGEPSASRCGVFNTEERGPVSHGS